MIKNYNANFRLLIFVCFFSLIFKLNSQTILSYSYTGSMQSFTVPACVSTISLDVKGAQGGANALNGAVGGLGGSAFGVITVSPGDVLNIYVGGMNGYNGGGAAGQSPCTTAMGGVGGGASDIRLNGVSLNNRVIVAGGGGGAGGDRSNGCGRGTGGGGGGGYYGGGGGCGYPQNSTTVPTGGTQTTGGNGGVSTFSSGQNGMSGLLGVGGAGGIETSSAQGGANIAFPGGVGGGLVGANGQQPPTNIFTGQSGAGGSSYLGTLTNTSTTSGNRTGNGIVTISYDLGLVTTISSSGSPTLCSGANATLTPSVPFLTYNWIPGGATTASIIVSHTSNTTYSVSGTVPGCPATASIALIVSSGLPTLSVVSSTNQLCFGKTATLTASGALSYTWTNGVTNGISFTPQSTNTYSVSGQNGCGIVTAVSTISVNPLPITVVSTHTAVCANKTATLSVTAAANSYTWEPGTIINSNPILIVSPQANTMYTISATDGTCSGVATISLQSDPIPTISASASSSVICPGGSITLSVTGGNNYTWTPGNQNGNTIVVNPTASTLYDVIGDNAFGCVSNAQQVVVVGNPPSVSVTASSYTLCNGNSSTLSATGANTHAWTNGPTSNNYTVTPMSTTIYTVIGTDNNNPCTAQQTVEITVITPILTVSGNTTICNGESTNLTGSGVTSYTWAHVGVQGAIVNVAPTSNTSYTINGESSINSIVCPVTAVVNIVVNQKPNITSVATRTAMCPKETNTITAGGANTYSWANTTSVVTGNTISFTSTTSGIIIYTLTGLSAQGCQASIVVPVNVSPCTGINELVVSNQLSIYPNPNNGEFIVTSEKEMTLNLINQLGQVAKQLELNNKNDYKVTVTNLSNGIYFIVGEGVTKKIIVSK